MEKLWNKVIDMPPSWLVIFMLAVWFQTRLWNPFGFDSAAAFWLGWALILGALGFGIVAILQFRRHRTSVIPRNTPSAIITTGPFAISRNPIYLADALILFGFSLIQGSVIGILSVGAFMALIRARFIDGEEAGLKAEFPEEFAQWSARTRRWI